MKTLTVTDWSKQDYAVEVEKNKSIKIDCTYRNAITPKPTTVEFKFGDKAEYDSYNMSYIGTITGITEKTVTITPYPNHINPETRRLKISEFCWRNWNFNLAKKVSENSETMNSI